MAGVCAGCGGSASKEQAPALPTTSISVERGARHVELDVPVAATEAARETGLMWRQSLGADEGMLFVFGADSTAGFWMKNTYVPLDIAYIAATGEVLAIAEGQPLDTTVLPPPGPYRYVLEMNAGWFGQHGFESGATVRFLKKLPPAS